MKKCILIVTLCLFALSGLTGCKYVQLKKEAEPCIDVAQYPNSIILETLGPEAACQTHKALVTISKGSIMMDEITYAELHLEILRWKDALSGANSVTAKSVKDVVIARLMKINKKLGVALFVVSESFMAFSDDTILGLDDVRVLILSLDDIDKQCKAITIP